MGYKKVPKLGAYQLKNIPKFKFPLKQRINGYKY